MTRVKRGVPASKRRKNVLKMTKGFRWRRKSNYQAAKEALTKAGKYAYRDRRNKKRVMRSLWIKRLNNALHQEGLKYNLFIKNLKDKKIEIDRKILSQIANEYPETFKIIVAEIKL
jgi:large subunit ribosomal protein L20